MKIYEPVCSTETPEEVRKSSSIMPTVSKSADSKHTDDMDYVWEQTSDLHTALLVCYHRLSLRLARSSIIGQYNS